MEIGCDNCFVNTILTSTVLPYLKYITLCDTETIVNDIN